MLKEYVAGADDSAGVLCDGDLPTIRSFALPGLALTATGR
jgi:hypothetical protein